MARKCEVTKVIYVPNTDPRVGTSVSMSYIGQGLRRAETWARISSSTSFSSCERRTHTRRPLLLEQQ